MKKKTKSNPKGKKLRCQHCWHNWAYGGASELYCTCPLCHYKVHIRKARTFYLAWLKNKRAKEKDHKARVKARQDKAKSRAKKPKAKPKRKVSK